MFDQTFVNTHAQTRRPWTVAASLTLQTGLVALAVILPMLNPEILRPKPLDIPIYFPIRATPQPIPVVSPSAGSSKRPVFTGPPKLSVPMKISDHASMIADDAPNLPFTGSATVGAAMISGLVDSLPTRALPLSEPKPVPVPKPVPPADPLHVSLGVQLAKLTFGPKPQYPALARTARVQGTVRLEAFIAANGAIRNLHVISGPPLLIRAAMDAVQQWRYQPTLLSGNTVEVITEIDVNFTLNQ